MKKTILALSLFSAITQMTNAAEDKIKEIELKDVNFNKKEKVVLPDDILTHIFSFVPQEGLFKTALLNQECNKLSCIEESKRFVLIQGGKREEIFYSFPSTPTIYIPKYLGPAKLTTFKHTPLLRKVTNLTLINCFLKSNQVEYVRKFCPNLQIINNIRENYISESTNTW